MGKRVLNDSRNRFAVYADCDAMGGAIDMHKQLKSKNITLASDGINVTPGSEITQVSQSLDWLSWLPFCAQEYQISADPADYVLLPTIICPSDIPNRNGVSFPRSELVRWCPEIHQQVYKGWKGCPTFSEHQNDDHKRARGVVIDSVMRPIKDFQGNLWKVLGLCAFDRTKYPDVAHRLLSRQTTTVSMGAYVQGYSCGLCGAPAGECTHINLRRPRDFYIDSKTGGLVFRKCHGLTPFEVSEVQTPAWTVAESPHTIDLSTNTAYQ